MIAAQEHDKFWADTRTRIIEGKGLPFMENTMGVLIRTVGGNAWVLIPDKLKNIIMRMSHYAKTARNSGGRKTLYTVRKGYYLPSMAVDSYATVRSWTECARELVK